MLKYAIVIESGPENFSAFVPDLPGCVAVGDTLEEVKREMSSAIAFHIDGLRQAGDSVPRPTTAVDYAEVA